MRSIKEWLPKIRTYIPSICIVVFSVLSISFYMYKIVKSDLSREEIIGNVVGSIIIGLTLSTLFRQQAINNARRSDIFVASLLQYAEKKDEAEKQMDKLPAFCLYKNDIELIDSKRDYLVSNSLSYKKYIDGYYDEPEVKQVLSKKQLRTLKNVENVRIYNITPHDLLCEAGSRRKYSTNRFIKPDSMFGVSQQKYMSRMTRNGLLSKFLLGFIFGYFTFKKIVDINNLEELLWTLFGLGVYLTLGIIDYFTTYNYMIETYRSEHILKKRDCLIEFMTLVNGNCSVIEQYDDYNIIMEIKKKRQEQEELMKLEQQKQEEAETLTQTIIFDNESGEIHEISPEIEEKEEVYNGEN